MPTNLYGKGDNYHEANSHVLPALLNRFHLHKLDLKKSIECWGTESQGENLCTLRPCRHFDFCFRELGSQ